MPVDQYENMTNNKNNNKRSSAGIGSLLVIKLRNSS